MADTTGETAMPDYTMGFGETLAINAEDGTILNVYRRPGPGPSVILNHGGTGWSRTWDSLLAALPAEWDVLAPDARGHGKSGRAPAYRWNDLVSDLSSLIRELDLTSPVLVGHSMGAVTVATYASQNPGASCIVIEDPAWWTFETKESLREKAATWRQSIETLQRGTIDAHLAFVKEQMPPHLSAAEIRARAEGERAFDPAVLVNVLETVPDWREVVTGIDCPALLVCGNPSLGAIVTPEQAKEIRQLNQRFEIAMVTGAGHAVSREAKDAYVEAVVPFISRLA